MKSKIYIYRSSAFHPDLYIFRHTDQQTYKTDLYTSYKIKNKILVFKTQFFYMHKNWKTDLFYRLDLWQKLWLYNIVLKIQESKRTYHCYFHSLHPEKEKYKNSISLYWKTEPPQSICGQTLNNNSLPNSQELLR